ncbi:MAG: FAD-binding oxidoreductase [Myxococcales bacterium]|nr:FAD-binding oxidoreductase [Myxococcales bacterium]MDH5307692.1 FAD-binding oxidoreductase [Myxococcales bacterium]
MLPCSIVTERANVLIVGGGIIGTSVAWGLARRGVPDVVVVDLDLSGIYASSELNAGGARATWWHPVNIDSCRETLHFFGAHRDEFGFRQRGYLWLYADRDLYARALDVMRLQNDRGLGVEALRGGELRERFPLIDRNLDELVGATFSPSDGLVNPNAVRQWYRREAAGMGVRFRNRHYVSGVSTARVAGSGGALRRVADVDVIEVAKQGVTDDAGVLREILVTHHVPQAVRRGESRIACDVLVNCLGAWSPIFSSKIGISDVTEPVRRQICLVDVRARDLAPDVSLDALGMIVDASDLYFHPEGPHVLAGYSIPEESPGFDFDYDGEEFFERHVWPRLAHRCSSFDRCAHVRGWSGLYAVTPDRSGIAGAVGGFSNLFEAHSFTGRGVMQSYAVGQALAELITDHAYGALDLGPLTRQRFEDPGRWVREELHI